MRQSKLTHEEDWRKYIEYIPDNRVEAVGDIEWNLTGRKEWDDKYHFKRKLVLADMFSKLGHPVIELECVFGNGIRFDLFTRSPNGMRIGCEVGELNTPSRKFKNRLKLSYENADWFIWWPNETPYGNIPLKYLDPTPLDWCCDICIKEQKRATLPMGWWPYQLVNEPMIHYIELDHLFEPELWHANIEPKLTENNAGEVASHAQITLEDSPKTNEREIE